MEQIHDRHLALIRGTPTYGWTERGGVGMEFTVDTVLRGCATVFVSAEDVTRILFENQMDIHTLLAQKTCVIEEEGNTYRFVRFVW